MRANYKKDVLPLLWYRHSGQPEIGGFPDLIPTKSIEEHEVTRDVGDHHITHLYIQNGVIPTLPDIAPELTHLRISGISATSELHNLSSVTKLKWLELLYNDFSESLPAVVGQLTSLETLDLSLCQLTDLPQSLSSLSQLEVLHLSYNDFSKGLPAVVGQLTSLEILSLISCQLSDLPQSLSSVAQLAELYLSGNDFSESLLAVVGQLTSLEKLELFNCQLSDLSQSLSSLTQLAELCLSGNDFSESLPAVVGQLTSLEVLHLSECQLSHLPQRFSCETQLEELYLSYNNFVRLSPAIHHLSNLKVLDLQCNKQLQILDEEVSQLQNLEKLECRCCWALQSPSFTVCKQGLEAVKKYFAYLKEKKEPEDSVLIQEKTDTKLSRALARINELEAKTAVLEATTVELENTNAMLAASNVELENKLSDVKSKSDNNAGKAEVTDSQLKVDEISQGEGRQATSKSAIDEGNVTKERQQYDVPSNLQQRDSADSSGDVSEQQDKILDYVFLPEDLGKKIEQLCQDHSVEDFQILQHPYKWQEVVVLAREAEAKLTTALKDMLADSPQYTEFIVEPFDYDGQSETELLHWQRTLNFDRETTTTGSAVCELIVQAGADSNKVYLVGPAHMMFCKEANEKFQTDKCDIKEIREEIETILPLRSVAIRSDHNTKVEIQPTPMIAYRYRYKQRHLPQNHHKLYANDCVLFQFDTVKAPQVQRELSSANLFRDEKLREVTTTDCLQGEHQRPLQIAVQGYRGHLYHTVNINRDIQQCEGVHLTFVLTSKDKEGHYHTLNNGDSGSIVYYIAEEKDGRKIHQPWGMLVQALILPRFNKRVYEAVVLNKVFRDIEEDYGLSPGEIQLYQLPNQGAVTSDVNVMSQQGNRTGPVPSRSTTAQVHKTSTTLTNLRTTTQAYLSNPSTAVSTEPVSSMPSISDCQQTPRVGPANLCSQNTQQANDLELIPPNLGCGNIQQENDRELVHAGLDYSVPQQATGSPEYSADDLSD